MARAINNSKQIQMKKVLSKFGEIIIDPAQAIYFPQGIVGFPKLNYYCLTNLPNNSLPGFSLLQSIDEDKFSFLLLPLLEQFYQDEKSLIQRADILQGVQAYNININDLKLYLITALKKEEDKIKITANLKAPIFVDTNNNKAYQHIFLRQNYSLAFPLN